MITKCVSWASVTLVTGDAETYGLYNVFVQQSQSILNALLRAGVSLLHR